MADLIVIDSLGDDPVIEKFTHDEWQDVVVQMGDWGCPLPTGWLEGVQEVDHNNLRSVYTAYWDSQERGEPELTGHVGRAAKLLQMAGDCHLFVAARA